MSGFPPSGEFLEQEVKEMRYEQAQLLLEHEDLAVFYDFFSRKRNADGNSGRNNDPIPV